MQLLDRQRNCGYFLHEFRADLVCDSASAGAGQEHTRVVTIDADLGFHPLQEFQGFFRLLGFVALVVLPEHLIAGRIDHHGFHSGRAYVEADHERGVVVVRLFGMISMLGRLGIKRSDLD